jgi:2,5-diketo-D-gluconate reductase A
LIDTAAAYENETGVRDAVTNSRIERDEIFITTKLWSDDQGREAARRAFQRSVERLGAAYPDLYLIHWPAPNRDLYVETWEALLELRSTGRVRSVGVSNFQSDHLERIIDATGEAPAVNQIELHPRLQQSELRRFHGEHDIRTEAWSPLGQGQILGDSTVQELASSRGKTPAQLVLRWHLQLGNVVIPKSVTPERIRENFELFDFELSEEDMRALGELDAGERIGPDPTTFG